MKNLISRLTQRRSLALFAAITLAVLPAIADSPPGPYLNGFETDTSGWVDLVADPTNGVGHITRRPSGYTNGGGYASGIASAAGGFHARVSGDPCDSVPLQDCEGPFTRWGGYSATFPPGGYRTQIDIYLDVSWAAAHPDGANDGNTAARFDFSSSINDSSGFFLRDFVFNAGTNPAGDPSSPGFYIGASTNAFRGSTYPENPCPNPSSTPNVCRTPVHIVTSGWYTFRHTFRDDAGFLAVDFDIFPLGINVAVASWTIHSGDAIAGVGGNRYGWLANEEVPDLAIDNSRRTGFEISLAPATDTNPVGTNHSVTARVTSTDADGHPSPGSGQAIEFDVISGPNAGQTSHPSNSGVCLPSDCTTDASGSVAWTYTSNGTPGTDTIQACFPNRPAVVLRAIGDEARQCRTVTKVWAVPSIPHDVDASLSVPVDIALGSAGTRASSIKASCKNESAPEPVRCTVQVSNLPAGCKVTSSAGPVVLSPGGFLVDNTSGYAMNETKSFNFTATTTCMPNLPKGAVFKVTFMACADGGNIDPAHPCQDADLVPDKSPNVVVKTTKLHR
jgi:hypothetical protein